MKRLNVVNFVSPNSTPEDLKAYELLVECAVRDFAYDQTAGALAELHRYVGEDQYAHFRVIIRTQMEIDTGVRRSELNVKVG